MIARMKKIILAGPKSQARKIINFLQDNGAVHLRKEEHCERFSTEVPMHEERSSNERILNQIESTLSLLPKPETHGISDSKMTENDLDQTSRPIKDIRAKRTQLQDELSVIKAYYPALHALSPILRPLSNSRNYESIGFILPKKMKVQLSQLKENLETAFTDQHIFLTKPISDDHMGHVITVTKSRIQEVRGMLAKHAINELKAPSYQEGLPLKDALTQMRDKLSNIPIQLQEIDHQLLQLSNRYFHGLQSLKNQTLDKISAIDATNHLGQTKKTFIISGYCPLKSIDALQKKLSEQFGESILLEIYSCEDSKELPPTMLDNPRFFRAFEMFIKILRPPVYGSIDPTPFFAFFFPIFFGIIMGDMGYGLVFLTIGLILRLRTKNITLHYIAEIVLICAFYTILFGFFYAEFFGDWLERYHILYPFNLRIGATSIELNRLHALMPLLIMAISIGVFHVVLGFLLKLYHAMKHRHHHESIEVVLILTTLASLFALIAVMANTLPALFKIPSVIALLIAIPVLVFMKGPMMLIELLSFIGNMLSYARIMAIGTASAYLAFVANMLGGLTGNIILGGMIVVLFHIINMILAFSPIIQSARLHYVEFFSKFYEPGGYHYNPLKKKGGEYQ